MTTPRPFGRALCAMITPFSATGELDLEAAARLAVHLVAEGCDGLVLNGTTGESPTTTRRREDRAGTGRARGGRRHARTSWRASARSSTRHTVELARAAEQAGADGLLVVTPYYSRPPQDAVEAHFRTRRGRHRTAGDAVRHPRPHRHPYRGGDPAAAGGPSADRGRQGLRVRPARLGQGDRPHLAGVLLGLRGAEPAAVRGGRRGLCQHGRERRPRGSCARCSTRTTRATPPRPPASINSPSRWPS